MEGSGPVSIILSSDEEPRLKRERNYTLRVTLVTEYANISSSTDFSEIEQVLTECIYLALSCAQVQSPRETHQVFLLLMSK